MAGGVAARLTGGLLALLLAGCASLPTARHDAAAAIAASARATTVDCARDDACALDSPLLAMARDALAQSRPQAPRHRALILDDGPDALLARVHLIRSARRSIELQTYIFDEDDAAQLVLDELQAAAFRGVKVRLLIDQLAALRKVETLAALSALHSNFEIRVYNPVLDRARLSGPMYAVAALCCLRRLNRRMHNKLLVIDDELGIIGGRNYQDDYYDWGEDFNFRDRDLLIAGPVAASMRANFDAFWNDRRSVPAERIGDVARYLRSHGPPPAPHHPYRRPQRVRALLADVADPLVMRMRFVDPALEVRGVRFLGDLPGKHRGEDADGGAATASAATGTGDSLLGLIEGAQREILLQTPYLVLSKPAQHLFRALHRRDEPPQVLVSTNSLASTDAFIAYAVSYKYKRRYLRDFGFRIHEFKPFPADAPFEIGATGAGLETGDDSAALAPEATLDATTAGTTRRERRLAARGLTTEPGSEAGRPSPFASSGGLPVRLKSAGLRIGLHAKSLVIDARIGVVGTHNFDPRGEALNTESAVVIEDPAFAAALAASIRRDMAPGNAWTIARREPSPILPRIEYHLARLSERMPIFDLWPVKYATSYDYSVGPGCPATDQPQDPFAPEFRRCNRPVGDFPEVDLGLKWLGVRVFTAFGSGLAPIL
ncbi:phospholipase D family protein [Thermomonas sp.]|uniref:phospholipase D family protein n=1 Tax=Thermomonas sp. TaxID=1971895 RepID=UPI00263265F3|nr:phospholipase D family protein [Thermomonas sp.]MCO5056252.1 phospholipase D family protein [Thermomonas sp.]